MHNFKKAASSCFYNFELAAACLALKHLNENTSGEDSEFKTILFTSLFIFFSFSLFAMTVDKNELSRLQNRIESCILYGNGQQQSNRFNQVLEKVIVEKLH